MKKLLPQILIGFCLCFNASFIFADEQANQPVQNNEQTMIEEVGGEVSHDGLFGGLGGKVKDRSLDFLDENVDDISRDLGTSIFEELTEFNLFDIDLGPLTGKAQVYRRLHPNYDVLKSYTVVDTFRLPLSLPIYSYSKTLPEITPGLSAGFSLGSSGSFEYRNIRQVVPQFVQSYPRWSDFSKKKGFFENFNWENLKSFFKENYQYTDEELENISNSLKEMKADSQDIGIEVTKSSKFSEHFKSWLNDPITKVRFSKLANVLLSPLKFPYKVEQLDKLHDGEIISYIANGYLHLSGNIGWSYSIDGLSSTINSQLSKTTYLNGQYTVSIIKENSRFAKVKIIRNSSKGISRSFYPVHLNQTFFDGIAVLGVDLSKTVTFTPFRFSSGNSKSKGSSWVFRYDLSTKKGQSAFEKAIYGLLTESQNIAQEELNKEEPAVKQIVQVDSNSTNSNNSFKFEIKYLFKYTSNKALSVGKSTIYIPDGPNKGVHHVKHGTYRKVSNWSSIFGLKEVKESRFQVSMNEEWLNQDKDEGLTLNCNFMFEDKKTSGGEYNSYLEKFHNYLGWTEKKIRNDVPTQEPKKTSDADDDFGANIKNHSFFNRAWYGKSHLSLSIQYNWSQLKDFIYLDREQKKEIMEKAFDLDYDLDRYYSELEPTPPRFEKAKKLLRIWNSLSNQEDHTEFHQKLSRFFSFPTKAHYKMNILHEALKEHEFAWSYNLYNDHLGREQGNSNQNLNADPYTGIANNELSFDRHAGRQHYTPTAIVTGLSNERLDKGRVKISFNLSEKPRYIYFFIEERTFGFTKSKVKIVLGNKDDRFKKGLNELILDKGSKDKLIKPLTQFFKNGRKFDLSTAIALEDGMWGGVKSTSFHVRGLPKKNKEDSVQKKEKKEKKEKTKKDKVVKKKVLSTDSEKMEDIIRKAFR